MKDFAFLYYNNGTIQQKTIPAESITEAVNIGAATAVIDHGDLWSCCEPDYIPQSTANLKKHRDDLIRYNML